MVALHDAVGVGPRTVTPDLAPHFVVGEPDPELERAIRLVGEAQVDVNAGRAFSTDGRGERSRAGTIPIWAWATPPSAFGLVREDTA